MIALKCNLYFVFYDVLHGVSIVWCVIVHLYNEKFLILDNDVLMYLYVHIERQYKTEVCSLFCC